MMNGEINKDNGAVIVASTVQSYAGGKVLRDTYRLLSATLILSAIVAGLSTRRGAALAKDLGVGCHGNRHAPPDIAPA